ncbi:hypothetical protein NL676_025263 [Syzygium grande]|nr:hypothetical protein NL676_025263 [Syzygium grande]
MKECVQELNPSFQRRKRGDSSFACEVEAYINSRKRLNKVITKYLRTLKKKGPNKDSHNEATLTILREAEEISLSVFQSLLGFLALTSATTKPRGWSLVSKLLEAKREERKPMKCKGWTLHCYSSDRAQTSIIKWVIRQSDWRR